MSVKNWTGVEPTTYFTSSSGAIKPFEKIMLLKSDGSAFTSKRVNVNNLSAVYDPGLCKCVETVRLSDGFYYLHVKVNAKVLLQDSQEARLSKHKYISSGRNIFLSIADRESSDHLKTFVVDWRGGIFRNPVACLLYTSPSPRDRG